MYGIERALGWWPATDPGSYTRFHPLIHGSWVVMEIATVIVSAVALTKVKFPFLTHRILVHLGRHCLQAERGRPGGAAFSPDAGARAQPERRFGCLDSKPLCFSFIAQQRMEGVHGWNT